MALNKNSDYKEEKQRLKYTINCVEDEIHQLEKDNSKIGSEMREAYMELDSRERSYSSYTTIMIDTNLQDDLIEKHAGLLKAKKSPYFARIDLRNNDSAEKMKYYIGKMAVSKKDDSEPLVIDWLHLSQAYIMVGKWDGFPT